MRALLSQATKPVVSTDSLEDLLQQKSPVTKNDSFEKIGSDDGDEDVKEQHRRSTFLTEVEIPPATEDVSDLLRDAQKVSIDH